MRDFDALLIDHAWCERKASAVGMSFVMRYPHRTLILDPMIQFAREELEHFHQVYRLIEERGLTLSEGNQDQYAKSLMARVKHGPDERFLDRLLMAAVIEARSFERMVLIENALEDLRLKAFYSRLARAEFRHREFFVEMADLYFPSEFVQERLRDWINFEQEAIESVPHRSALH